LRRVVLILALVLASSSHVGAGFEDLARAEEWPQILEVARLRTQQLPLRPEEAYVAAVAAERVGDTDGVRAFLELAVAGGPVADLAVVRLAAAVVGEDPQRALALALPVVRSGARGPLREAVVEIVESAAAGGLDASQTREVERLKQKLPRSLRRRVELAAAMQDTRHRRARLAGLLAQSSSDLVASRAAELLEHAGSLSPVERWGVAQSLYRHALYARAMPHLEALAQSRHRRVPGWHVAYLRGRCAFRTEEWETAAHWYARAVPLAPNRDRAAKLEVHQARAFEIAGRLEDAVEAGRRAVRVDTTDDRRLFLAALRLRQGRADLAAAGIARSRSTNARDRGAVMLALHDLKNGRPEQANRRLGGVRSRKWRAPARVVVAQLAAAKYDWPTVLTLLGQAAGEADQFWANQILAVMRSAPNDVVAKWRVGIERDFGSTKKATRRRALIRWSVMEPNEAHLEEIRNRVASEFELEVLASSPGFPGGLAGQLWNLGLEAEAVRWDPGGFPTATASETLWTASMLLSYGRPERSIRIGDAAWRMAGSAVSLRTYPDILSRCLHPFPEPELTRSAAQVSGIDWALVAGLVREESRWDPAAISAVGARGLTQLMPATAATAADRIGEPKPGPDRLFDPAVGLRLGATELGRLISRFDGSVAPAIAAYNAGEAQARLWLGHCGSQCNAAEYVLTVSFDVTRSYTAAVMSAAQDYERLYRVSAGGALRDENVSRRDGRAPVEASAQSRH